jgi:Ca2+-binding RTX toxin-like protein
MLAGAMIMGLMAAVGLSGLAVDGDEDEAREAPETDEVEPQQEGGQTFLAGGIPGVTVVQGFTPGTDALELRVPGDVDALELSEADDAGGAAIAYVSAGDETVVRFDGLDSVPVDDVGVLIDGDGEAIPLALLLEAAEPVAPSDAAAHAVPSGVEAEGAALPPDDPGAPSEPGGGGDDPALPPDDPEAPSTPGDPDQPGEEVLAPVDPTQPAGAGTDATLAALMGRDGADATGQTDIAGAVTVTGEGDDLLDLGGDGIDGTGTGAVTLSEAAAVTGGAVVDLGAGADTLVAGDAALHAFGGAGDDDMTAGDGGGALYGGAGDDALTGDSGAGGTDLLHGGAGDDTLIGGDGGEYLDGGEHAEAPGATGDDQIAGGGGDDTIRGGWGADSLSGGAGHDVIDHRGADEIRIIEEEWHHDWHTDGAVDTLDGGAGDDSLSFGSGDLVTGGAGEDLFWLYPEGAGAEPAVITDFAPGEDFLRITVGTEMQGLVKVVPSEDGADRLVLLDGQLVAILEDSTATVADIYVEVRPEIFP